MRNPQNQITIKGQRYHLPTVTTKDMTLLRSYANNPFLFLKEYKPYGIIKSREHKRFRYLLKALIRAKHKPSNVNKDIITVKLSDRSVSIRALSFENR